METHDNVLPTMPAVLFREIHKNSFLKKLSPDRRAGFPKRVERVWAVFCVHDDTEAFLEFYQDHKIALAHKPDWFVSLHNALHISPSIVGQGDEFEFAVTLPTHVVRLAASSWESMMEWVETMRNKLRELRVLAPKDNIYSKMPEPRHVLLPTRDPTSPLPLPPIGPSGLLPGVESPRPSGSGSSPPSCPDDLLNSTPRSTADVREAVGHARAAQHDSAGQRFGSGNLSDEIEVCETSPGSDSFLLAPSTSSRSDNDASSRPFSPRSQQTGSPSLNVTHAMIDRRKDKSVVTSMSSGSSVVIVNDVCCQRPPAALPDEASEPVADTNIAPQLPTDKNGRRLMRAASVPSASNVTVIEVPPPSNLHYEHLFSQESLVPTDIRTKVERVNSSGLIPRLPSSRVSRECDARLDRSSPHLRGIEPISPQTSLEGEGERTVTPAGPSLLVQQKDSPQHTSVVTVKPQEINFQMAVKVPAKQTAFVRVNPPSNSSADSSLLSILTSQTSSEEVSNSLVEAVEVVPPISAAFQPVPAGLNVRDIPLIGGHQRRRRRSSSSDAGPVMRGLVGADLIRVAPAEAETPADEPRRTLRETQVCQLRREMGHPGGVRLPLRRKDCIGAIALVDICNCVWVAGWKQREHPMLYNALHIGDRVVSVGDVPVRTAGDAHKLLRGVGGPTVELVVRRLPLGVVLSLQRPRGGGDVGLLPDANSSAEVTVVPGGTAARSGLPPRTATMDGLSLTTWTLTEINGRPLNLFCKPSEVTTRLNSVGKELSVLVQPSDFIKQVRKQLKAMRGYKDYLLL